MSSASGRARGLALLVLALSLHIPALASEPTELDDTRWAQVPAELTAYDPGPGTEGAPRDHHQRIVEMARGLDGFRGLSKDPRWRAIMGWGLPSEIPGVGRVTALEASLARYPVPEGREDPALDLRESIALAWTQPAFSCRFPLRARFLARHQLIPLPLAIDQGQCEDYEAFARPDAIASIDLLFTVQGWGEPGTSAGHVLFKVHEASASRAYNEDDSRTFSYAVNMDIEANQENLVWRGLVGLAHGELIEGNANVVEETYGTSEKRDIHVYRLNLSQEQMRDLMALFWVQKRDKARTAYTFFSINCARLTYDALRTVLPDLPYPSEPVLHPHEVVVLLGPYLSPLGIRASRRRKAVQGERQREELAEVLSDVEGFDALHDQRWGTHAERTHAMEVFAEVLGLSTLTEDEREALADYLDAVIDIEVYDIDVQQGFVDDNVTTPLLDAAIDLRARLPIRPRPTLEPLPEGGLDGSGSRRLALRSGVNHQGEAVANIRTGIIDEQPGDPFSVSLNRYGRNEFLVTDIALRLHQGDVTVDEVRTTILSVANYSTYVRTTAGWWESHTGFAFDVTMQSLPSQGIPLGVWVRVGQSLSLIQSYEHLGLLVLGADLSVASWLHEGDYLRAGVGVWLEGSLPFTESGAHRLSVTLRAQPTWVWDRYVTELELVSRLDFTVSRALGCMLGVYVDLDRDRVLSDQWQAGVHMSWGSR